MNEFTQGTVPWKKSQTGLHLLVLFWVILSCSSFQVDTENRLISCLDCVNFLGVRTSDQSILIHNSWQINRNRESAAKCQFAIAIYFTHVISDGKIEIYCIFHRWPHRGSSKGSNLHAMLNGNAEVYFHVPKVAWRL